MAWSLREHRDDGMLTSGVTESLFWEEPKGGGGGGQTFIWGPRGRHRNEVCTIKSQMGGIQKMGQLSVIPTVSLLLELHCRTNCSRT